MTVCTCTEKEYLQFKIDTLVKSTIAYAVAEYKLYSFKKLRISLNHDRKNKDNIRILTL